MKLTVVEKGKKVYATIGDESILLHPEILITFHRHLNQTIDAKTFEKLKTDNLYYHTLSTALKKLSFKAYSKKALEEKLDAPEAIKTQVMHELKRLGYLDDQKLLKQYVEDFFYQPYAKKMFIFKLIEKGFKKADIEAAFESVEIDEITMCVEALSKKQRIYQKDPLNKQKEKLKRHALSLGYSFSVIETAISRLTFEAKSEKEMLKAELKKHKIPTTKEEKEKLKAKLFRRGFRLDDINQALKEEL